MSDLLKPQLAVEPRPSDPDLSRYVRSYLIMRVLVGALGIALPVVLVVCDGFALGGDPFPRGSLSAYYYSGMRELFVGVLSATAVFLIAYKVAEHSLDNTLSLLAGLAVVGVAVFPTGVSGSSNDLTPIQDRLGEGVVQGIHYACAATFIVSLAFISYFFGRREGARSQSGRRSPAFWRRYHIVCAVAIAAALLWLAVTWVVGAPSKAVLIGEWIAVWAFGASWLMKGLELDALLRREPRHVAVGREATSH